MRDLPVDVSGQQRAVSVWRFPIQIGLCCEDTTPAYSTPRTAHRAPRLGRPETRPPRRTPLRSGCLPRAAQALQAAAGQTTSSNNIESV